MTKSDLVLKNMPVDPENQETCKNCGATFQGNYCPECGQSLRDFQKPFGMVAIDFLGNMAAFDTRLWHTIKPLLLKPGKLTAEFFAGRRVRYVPPFRLLFFFSFVFFLILGFQTHRALKVGMQKSINLSGDSINGKSTGIQLLDSLQTASQEGKARAQEALKEVSGQLNQSIDSASTPLEQGALRKVAGALEKTKDKISEKQIVPRVLGSMKSSVPKDGEKVNDFLLKVSSGLKMAADSTDSAQQRENLLKVSQMLEHPEFFISKLFQVLSWMIFLLIPVFAFIMRLFFRKSHPYYINHLIFTVHFHAYLYMIGIIALLTKWVSGPILDNYIMLILILMAGVYFFLSIRKFYQRTWWVTVKRFVWVSVFYFISLMIMMTAASVISYKYL